MGSIQSELPSYGKIWSLWKRHSLVLSQVLFTFSLFILWHWWQARMTLKIVHSKQTKQNLNKRICNAATYLADICSKFFITILPSKVASWKASLSISKTEASSLPRLAPCNFWIQLYSPLARITRLWVMSCGCNGSRLLCNAGIIKCKFYNCHYSKNK